MFSRCRILKANNSTHVRGIGLRDDGEQPGLLRRRGVEAPDAAVRRVAASRRPVRRVRRHRCVGRGYLHPPVTFEARLLLLLEFRDQVTASLKVCVWVRQIKIFHALK